MTADLGLRRRVAGHPTLAYLIRRFLQYVVTMWAAFTATFFFFRMIPGDPLTSYLQSLPRYTPAGRATVSHYEKAFDLNGNLLQQYGVYLYQLVVRHDLGPSLVGYPTPALVVVARAVPWTVGLLGLSAVIAWFLGVLLGAVAGWRRDSALSTGLTYCALALSNVPFFFIAVILVLVFSFTLNVMPATYPYGPGMEVSFSLPFILSVVYHALIPAFSLVLVATFATFLGMRQQMISVLGEDYLTFAAAKGLHPWRILRRYGLPNCYLPQITGLMVNLGFIVSGNIVLEQFFIYPGVGHLLGTALAQRDFNTLMAITDVIIFIVLTAVFLIDMLLPLLDPRIRYQR